MTANQGFDYGTEAARPEHKTARDGMVCDKRVTARGERTHRQFPVAILGWNQAVLMVSRLPLNRFERVLFGVAVLLAVTLVVCRLGYMILVSYLRYAR